jgi:hypothetical protein
VVKPTFAGRILWVDERIAARCALLHVPVRSPWRDSLIAATTAEQWPDRGDARCG